MNTWILFTILLPMIDMIMARPQQPQIDPAYLRDYYAQLSQQNGGVRGSVSDASVFDQGSSFQPSAQVATVGSQIRVRDPGQEQVTFIEICFFLNKYISMKIWFLNFKMPNFMKSTEKFRFEFNSHNTPFQQSDNIINNRLVLTRSQ